MKFFGYKTNNPDVVISCVWCQENDFAVGFQYSEKFLETLFANLVSAQVAMQTLQGQKNCFQMAVSQQRQPFVFDKSVFIKCFFIRAYAI